MVMTIPTMIPATNSMALNVLYSLGSNLWNTRLGTAKAFSLSTPVLWSYQSLSTLPAEWSRTTPRIERMRLMYGSGPEGSMPRLKSQAKVASTGITDTGKDQYRVTATHSLKECLMARR